MSYLGSWKIDDYLTIPATTHRFSTGAAYAPTSLTYTIYEDDSTVHLVENVDMVPAAPFDGIVGFYLAKIQLLAITGFEKGKNYTIVLKATVDSVAAISYHTFQIEAEVDANTVSASVTLAATQGAITWGQQKIAANVAGEGALDIRNANATGIGQLNSGETGVYNVGTDYGQYNSGAGVGQYNAGSGVASAGQANQGVAQGQYNLGGAYGEFNSGDNYGQANTGTGAAGVGQLNDGTIDGQYNNGGTYGMQNTGASGQVNVGTAGDGVYASGTDHGIELAGTVSALGANILAEFFSVDSGETSATAIDGSVVKEIADSIAATVFPSGAINFTYTVTDSVTALPIEGVEVWFSTDNPAVNIVWKGDTDAFGVARDVLGNLPALDVGVYFIWRQRAGYTFSDPDTETVS